MNTREELWSCDAVGALKLDGNSEIMGSDGNTGSIKLQVKEMKIETENKEVSCIRGGGAQSDDNLLLHSGYKYGR
ncbi:hypothetical protein WN943_021495 [Citrus x changshan-huyou]